MALCLFIGVILPAHCSILCIVTAAVQDTYRIGSEHSCQNTVAWKTCTCSEWLGDPERRLYSRQASMGLGMEKKINAIVDKP